MDAIDALHAEGLEVIIDVVFNHSAELDRLGPTLSLRGLANAHYYSPGSPRAYLNWTGCGNVVRLAEPRVVELVVGALRHWAGRYHWWMASASTSPPPSARPPRPLRPKRRAVRRAAGRPAAVAPRWIAEPWDIGAGGYQLGAFPPAGANGTTSTATPCAAGGCNGRATRAVSPTASRPRAGSSTHGRAPTASVNFICAHDGFTCATW